MSDITFSCPQCGKSLVVAQEGAGMTFDCPDCKQQVTAPKSASPDHAQFITSNKPSNESIHLQKPSPDENKPTRTFEIIMAARRLATNIKNLGSIALILSVVAIAISLYSTQSCNSRSRPATGRTQKDVAVEVIKRPRWDGTDEFFNRYRSELIKNIEIANFLETDGVGIAFVRTTANKKLIQFTIWLRKSASGWTEIRYFGPRVGNPYVIQWVRKHERWLEEMSNKDDEWSSESECVW